MWIGKRRECNIHVVICTSVCLVSLVLVISKEATMHNKPNNTNTNIEFVSTCSNTTVIRSCVVSFQTAFISMLCAFSSSFPSSVCLRLFFCVDTVEFVYLFIFLLFYILSISFHVFNF